MKGHYFDFKNSKEYEAFITNYLASLGVSCMSLVAEIKEKITPEGFSRFYDVYPISLRNRKSKEEITEYYNICYNTLSASVNDVLSILIKYLPNFYNQYKEKIKNLNFNNKNQELIEFYGTDDISLIKKVMTFFAFNVSGMLLLYCPLINKSEFPIDLISNYINLTKTSTRELIGKYSSLFKSRIVELEVDNFMRFKIKRIISLFESQLDKKIILMVFGLLDGRRYSTIDISTKLNIDTEYIKDLLVNFSNMLHEADKKSHNL